MRLVPALTLLVAFAPLCAAAKPKDDSGPARAAFKEALARGDVDGLRVSWTMWLDRSVSLTVEVKKGKLTRFGGLPKGQRSERAVTADEKKELLAALRGARADALMVVNRDVKNERDRVLNLDVVQPDGALLQVGAFVRISSTWRTGPTAPLADLLEKWLAP
ncbi:MAG: hypothetical protein EXR72_14545 [Myxococcales bacterium]|nr:hypothetical protein [Myxococcales bacterium]